MDIIDIMLARAMTPQGKTEIYVAKANAAAAKAEKAEQDAESAIATVEAAAEEIATAKEEASDLLATAQEVLETAQSAQINMPEVYTTTGQNIDGYMTQKAVTDALLTKADITTVNTALAAKVDNTTLNNYASKTYVNQAIANIPSGGGSTVITGEVNLGAENAGKIVIVNTDGGLRHSNISEADLEELLMQSDGYIAQGIIGLTSDFENKSFERIHEAAGKTAGSDFNAYPMYGGRMRCNVADDGTINAFYGDPSYTEDGSNGQVMLYQPKFYYQRVILKSEDMTTGKIVRKESLMLSATPRSGFKIHPLFETSDHNILEYVLLPVYDGCAYDVSEQIYILDDSNVDITTDKLSSIAGAKPISGVKHSFTITDAERMATNRGNGWHITNMAAESANQMLEAVEFGMFNGQIALENGLTSLPSTNSTTNGAANTGSTASLGNNTGYAESTTVITNGVSTVYTTAGKRAINYRGMENPWGNIWHFIGGIIINGNRISRGGLPYICKDFNYTGNQIGRNYESINFTLPSTQDWVSAMGYGNSTYDWVYMPIECAETANSATPIGDKIWTVNNLNGNCVVVSGGMWTSGTNSGPFYYGCDRTIEQSSNNSYSARLMYIPVFNSNNYNTNYQAWLAKMGA